MPYIFPVVCFFLGIVCRLHNKANNVILLISFERYAIGAFFTNYIVGWQFRNSDNTIFKFAIEMAGHFRGIKMMSLEDVENRDAV